MVIQEYDLNGSVWFETAPNTGTITWTDITDYVSNANVTRGGNVGLIGIVDTQPGSGTITLVDHSGTIGVGYWVRIRNAGGNVWSGYVSDIFTNIEYRDSVRYEFKTLIVGDYVSWLGQFIMPDGLGANANGATGATGVDYSYAWDKRINYIHYVLNGNTFNTDPNYEAFISTNTYGSPTVYELANTSASMSVVDLLDLTANSVPARWHGTVVSPTNNTNGRAGIANFFVGNPPSSGVKFSDGTHTSGTGFLGYSQLDISQSTNSVVNNVRVTNTAQFARVIGEYDTSRISTPAISRSIPDQVISVNYETSNSTSIANYNFRNGAFTTNHPNSAYYAIGASEEIETRNLCANPNFEAGADGWDLTATQARKSVRRPSDDPLAGFLAKNGENALRLRVTTANASEGFAYNLSEFEGVTVPIGAIVGLNRRLEMNAWAARSTTPTDARAWGRIVWKDKDDATISTVDGTKVTLTTAGTWYKVHVNSIAPATAVKAELHIRYDRSGGANLAVGTMLWADQVTIYRTDSSSTNFYSDLDFDGNTSSDDTYQYFWLGTPNQSESVLRQNTVAARANQVMNANATPYKAPKRLVWNAQQDLTKVDDLDLNKTVEVWFEGTKWTSVISGIQHEIRKKRWLVTLELEPSLGV